MSKDITENLLNESQSEETQFRMLVTIYLDDITFYLCANDTENIVFAGQEYESVEIKRSEVQTSLDGSLEKITLTLSNADLIIASYVAINGNKINNRRCLIQEVSLAYLDNSADAITVFDGVMNNLQMDISTYTVDVQRTLGSFQSLSPVMTYSPLCQYKQFGDERCRYNGPATNCDRTFARCKELGNQLRYGGHISITEQMK